MEAVRASFGLPSGLAMLAGIVVGLLLPAIDDAAGIRIPALAFESQSSARSLLETIGTATVSVAGLSFSVTIVALSLASSQLSPRVLRTFRGDRLSQMTLALFLGTFIYCLTLLVRLGVSGDGSEPPNLSITLAVLLAFTAFLTFAIFIGHIIRMLQPSTVVSGVLDDARALNESRYPSGPGDPEDPAAASRFALDLIDRGGSREVRASGSGYLTLVKAGRLIKVAEENDAVVLQNVPLGDYVLEGQVVAEVWSAEGDSDELEPAVRKCFVLGKQRTLDQDIAFCVRQLTDIALKGLSPGINDPTTAEIAMDTMCAFFVAFVGAERPSEVRVDGDGHPRFIASAPSLNDLIKLGFDQVRVSAEGRPTFNARLLELLILVETEANRNGVTSEEIERQRQLIASPQG
ncbi:MAG: DUF2254 domain-containing protein [Solirubrobacterales bacterium]|nr:DUF2254 domain-containing protein [Solirubrobacterales bacterium]